MDICILSLLYPFQYMFHNYVCPHFTKHTVDHLTTGSVNHWPLPSKLPCGSPRSAAIMIYYYAFMGSRVLRLVAAV